MGKKYIIEIPEDKIPDFVGSTHFLMPYMMAGHIGHHDTGLLIEPYTEPDLEQVRKEAYAEGFKDGQYAERNGLVANYAQVHKIKIGDEVENTQTGVKFIVTHLWENNQGEQGVSGFNQECSAFSTTLSLVVKTGRTFPEIATVLEKMRGEQLRQAQRGIKHE